MNHIKHLPYQTRKQKLCKTKDKKKKKKKCNSTRLYVMLKMLGIYPIFGVFLNLFQAPKSLLQ